MKIKNIIFALSLFTCAFAPINGMNKDKTEERQHAIKLSYKKKPLSWRQTTTLLESKYLKDIILNDENEYYGEEIAIDEIIDNENEKECFKNNILDSINIFPKKSYKNLNMWNDENKDTLNNEISKITKKDTKKIMDMIRCAQYIDSPVSMTS